MGGRLGLCESRRARAQGARRRDARQLLDRSADVPGRLGFASSVRAIRSRSRTRLMGSISRPRSPSSPATCRWAPRREEAAAAIRLVVLVNDVSLRNLIPAELGEGLRLLPVQALLRPLAGRRHARRARRRLGRRQAAPAAALDPQRPALRQAECGRRHDLRLPDPDRPRGQDPRRSAPARSSARARSPTRTRTAGRASRIAEGGVGYSCLAELRTVETILQRRGQNAVHALRRHVRIEMKDEAGQSIFGAIEQEVVEK